MAPTGARSPGLGLNAAPSRDAEGTQWHQRRISARSQWRDRAGFAPDFPKPPADERRKHNRTTWARPPPVARIARRRAAIV